MREFLKERSLINGLVKKKQTAPSAVLEGKKKQILGILVVKRHDSKQQSTSLFPTST